jgi:tRNA A37 methylthiotransferase MiaB
MILLVTLNSTYQHCSFGLRYLKANMQELESQTQILEPTIQIHPRDLVEKILKLSPKIVGFGVYIWNATQTLEVVSLLKKVAPDIKITVGGPEVSFESESQEIVKLADYLIKGEADFLFYDLCKKILSNAQAVEKIQGAILPEVKNIKLPYSLYSDEDIKNRIIYVEASRGCPYKCEYCLSSLDKSVRSFDLDLLLGEIQTLISRGARQFKFVDRTFNLSPTTSLKILRFFLERSQLGLFLHFEMVPDRLPEELRELIKQFPAGSLQFEIGIQTWNPNVAELVSRKNDFVKVQENIRFLVEETHVHIHADLIAGLPGEDLESFGRGFDALSALRPHEVQLGILKRLKGTPISRHDLQWQMVYQDQQPFQVLKTKSMSFEDLQFIGRFSKFWDHYANNGHFVETFKFFELLTQEKFHGSLFAMFSNFSIFLSQRFEMTHHLSLESLTEALWVYLVTEQRLVESDVRQALVQDYCFRVKRRDLPRFLKDIDPQLTNTRESAAIKRRQTAHLQQGSPKK